MTQKPRVSIVILNWNGRNYLEQFLPSVLGTVYSNLEVVVADNGSTDGSVEFLQKHYPELKLILFDQNLGFAKGYNEALKKVDTGYYAILNSDVEVSPGWLEPIIDLLEQDPTHAACQPKLLDLKNPGFFEYAGGAGGWLDSFGYPFTRGRVFDTCEQDNGQYDETSRIFWASGAAMIIRSSVFHECGGFDEYFFAHQEEIDLCWRIQLAGYKIFACPSSIVYHLGGGTLPSGNTLKTYLNFRNNHIMLFKNLPWSQKWWKIPFRFMLDATSAWKGVFSGKPGYFVAILRSHLGFARWLFLHRTKNGYSRKPTGKLNGVYHGNLAWDYFIRGKKYFSQLMK